MDPELNPTIPEVSFEIEMAIVKAEPRRLKTLRPPRYIDVIERLAAIAAGKPDPGEWERFHVSAVTDLRALLDANGVPR